MLLHRIHNIPRSFSSFLDDDNARQFLYSYDAELVSDVFFVLETNDYAPHSVEVYEHDYIHPLDVFLY